MAETAHQGYEFATEAQRGHACFLCVLFCHDQDLFIYIAGMGNLQMGKSAGQWPSSTKVAHPW